MFKSYYVVWKLTIKYLKLSNENGLNRTMQYGNWEGEKLIGTGIKV